MKKRLMALALALLMAVGYGIAVGNTAYANEKIDDPIVVTPDFGVLPPVCVIPKS